MNQYSNAFNGRRAVGTMLSCCLLTLATTVFAAPNAPTPAEQIRTTAESLTDKLLGVILVNKQLDSNSPATMEFDDTVVGYRTLYCSPDTAIPGQPCTQTDPTLANADIQISSLLSASTIPDSEQGLDLAARVFTRNMVGANTTKFNNLQFSDVQGPNKDKSKVSAYATGLLNAAIMSIPTFSFAEMYANRKTNAGYVDVQNPDAQPSSLMSYLGQVSGRMQDKKWVDNVIKTTDALALQRKQIFMQAEQLFMDYQRYRQGERIEALLSALITQNEKQREFGASLMAQTKAPVSASELNEQIQKSLPSTP